MRFGVSLLLVLSSIMAAPALAAPLAVTSITFQNADGTPPPTLFTAVAERGRSGPTPLWPPHWTSEPARAIPAVFARGARVRILATVRADEAGVFDLAVAGTVTCPARRVELADGGTAEVVLEPAEPLPDRVGPLALELLWTARAAGADPLDLGATRHELLLTLAPSVVHGRMFRELAQWAVLFAAGLDDEKDVADALIRRLPETGLHYGRAAWDTYGILANGGGMCGGWCQFFRDLAAVHGIDCPPWFFTLRRDSAAAPERKWLSIDIHAPGLNNEAPAFQEECYFVDEVYPKPRYLGAQSPDDDVRWYESRDMYRFVTVDDGHCVNFLCHEGAYYMYDASFGGGPFGGFFGGQDGLLTGPALAAFRGVYFDAAVDHLQGKVLHRAAADDDEGVALLDVKTPLVPDAELAMVFERLDFKEGRASREAARAGRFARLNGARDESAPVDWRELRERILTARGPLGASERQHYADLLARRAPLAVEPGVPLPGVASPLELVQGAVISRCAAARERSLAPLVDEAVRTAPTAYLGLVRARAARRP